ncbi:hypothetical protein GCM10023237_12070 [Streptomyces coeruleoprunus]
MGPGTEDGEDCWVPVALSHLNWRQGEHRSLPRTHHLNYAGIATGQGLDDAVERGLLEVVERDALELWWHLDGPTRGIDPDSVPGLTRDLDGSALDVWIVEMPSEFAPCMAALVHDPARDLYAAGFACRYDPAEAARKAVLEAVHTWVFTQGTTDPDGWVFRAIDAGLLARGLYLDHRADRRYLDDCGEHFAAVRDLGAHVQVWLDPGRTATPAASPRPRSAPSPSRTSPPPPAPPSTPASRTAATGSSPSTSPPRTSRRHPCASPASSSPAWSPTPPPPSPTWAAPASPKPP